MRKLLLLFLLFPTILFSQEHSDSLLIIGNQEKIENLSKQFEELHKKYEFQTEFNEQTLNSISNQIGATSYNLSIFAILFGVLAIGLGVYVTWVERKIIRIREENESLLKQTVETKNEVVAINELIQKDIYGLFIKIKQEETNHILKRLIKIPEDISNLTNELLSRELRQEDFPLLKKAYLRLKPKKEKEKGFIKVAMDYHESYLLLFFQHFLDLSLKDEQINKDLIEFYPHAIQCAFENDIIKSTEDFTKALIDLGYQSKTKEINGFLTGISKSDFKNLSNIYQIIFNGLKNRNDQFKFYELLSNEKDLRISKKNYGNLLIDTYQNSNLTPSEMQAIEEIKQIQIDLDKEAEEKRIEEEKQQKAKEERKRKFEELKTKK